MHFVLLLILMVTPAAAAMPEPAAAGWHRLVAADAMSWHIERGAGPQPGSKSCVISSLGRHVSAHLVKHRQAPAATWSVLIGFENQPGTLKYLRVNKKIYQTDRQAFRGTEALEIIARLKVPGEFAYEWFKRPSNSKQGGLFATGDFAAKASACEHWVNGTRA